MSSVHHGMATAAVMSEVYGIQYHSCHGRDNALHYIVTVKLVVCACCLAAA